MATMERSSAVVPLSPVPPSGVQPGGHGLFVRLELAWGRVRRAWLRRFRPGYVRHMAEKRQGHCPDCRHDIIDSRDLKYWRNVCGFWFRPEDDPFCWRNRLRLARYGLAEVVGVSVPLLTLSAVLAGLAVGTHWLFAGPLVIVLGLWVFLVSFFRDPERTIPNSTDALLSPADGTITSVGEVEVPDFPGGRAFRVVIFLSPFNVHINRVPRSGRVVGLRYFKGCFAYAAPRRLRSGQRAVLGRSGRTVRPTGTSQAGFRRRGPAHCLLAAAGRGGKGGRTLRHDQAGLADRCADSCRGGDRTLGKGWRQGQGGHNGVAAILRQPLMATRFFTQITQPEIFLVSPEPPREGQANDLPLVERRPRNLALLGKMAFRALASTFLLTCLFIIPLGAVSFGPGGRSFLLPGGRSPGGER